MEVHSAAPVAAKFTLCVFSIGDPGICAVREGRGWSPRGRGEC